jgi:flagellar hook-length control protein FliK
MMITITNGAIPNQISAETAPNGSTEPKTDDFAALLAASWFSSNIPQVGQIVTTEPVKAEAGNEVTSVDQLLRGNSQQNYDLLTETLQPNVNTLTTLTEQPILSQFTTSTPELNLNVVTASTQPGLDLKAINSSLNSGIAPLIESSRQIQTVKDQPLGVQETEVSVVAPELHNTNKPLLEMPKGLTSFEVKPQDAKLNVQRTETLEQPINEMMLRPSNMEEFRKMDTLKIDTTKIDTPKIETSITTSTIRELLSGNFTETSTDSEMPSSADAVQVEGVGIQMGSANQVIFEVATIEVEASDVIVQVTGPVHEIAEKISPDKAETIEIRLDPRELGSVEVKISSDSNGHVSAHISADNEQAGRILAQEIDQLREQLERAGLVIENLDVSVGHDKLAGSDNFEQNSSERQGSYSQEVSDTQSSMAGGTSEDATDRLLSVRI